MSAVAVTQAILQYSATSAYPEEDVTTSEVTPESLHDVIHDLRRQREDLKQEIRSLSKTTGTEVETWISQAKELERDIKKSREIARQIVQDHDHGNKIQAQVHDTKSKITLLEGEVAFEQTLEQTLVSIKHANTLLLSAQDAVVQRDIGQAFERLGAAKAAVPTTNLRCATLLAQRAKTIQHDLETTLIESWTTIVQVDVALHQIVVSPNNITAIDSIIKVAHELDVVHRIVHHLSKGIEKAILRPLFENNQSAFKAVACGNALTLQKLQADLTAQSLFDSLERVLSFVSTSLPQISRLLDERLMPTLLTKLQDDYLEPALPIESSQIESFEHTRDLVSSFVTFAKSQGYDASPLLEWLNNIPRAWLTKRREAMLGDVRNLVFQGLHETKTVERVESQMVSKEDAIINGGDDDWDTAWDEEREAAPSEHPAVKTPASDTVESTDDDEGSAWDVDDADDNKQTANADEDAWGWGDDANASPVETKPSAKVDVTHHQAESAQRELTLRETYTVTGVPDGVLAAIQQIISDAQILAADYSTTSLAPAVAGLYSLPTLSLAIYRATAPTAYNKMPTGNMLIYNDATRLAEQLRAWQASQPPASRLRLDNDASALDHFARRAYSAEMDAQKTILRDLLDGAQGFTNCTVSPFKEACESAVEQTADRLQDVYRLWQPVLGHNALLQTIGQLLSSVTLKMIEDIEDLSDIGEEDSRQLKILCDRLSAVKTIFTQQQPDGASSDMTFVYCPNWLKLQYLAVIMESSLADIKYMWNDGELSLEFSSEELVDLIKALFADSDHRRKLIGELRRQSGR